MNARRAMGGPRGVGPLRRTFGGPVARLLGIWDGVVASADKSSDVLHKFKDRAELGGADAAKWWADVSGALNAEIDGLAARLADGERNEPRMVDETASAQATYDASKTYDDETRLRRFERDLAHLRQERGHLTERLRRTEAQRDAAYQRARAAANEFLQHYESVMRSYKASNKKAVDTGIPAIEFPDELRAPHYAGHAQAPDDAPAAPTAPQAG